jgi:protein-tyrosine phosphatase
MNSILIVCRANLCRSPMAEVVLRACAPAMGVTRVGSAGAWAGSRPEPMDARAKAALERRKYTVPPKWRSRRVQREDLAQWDLILAADTEVLANLQALWPEAPANRLRLFLDHVPEHHGQDLPDPYFSSTAGFEAVLDLIERSVATISRRRV